MIVSAFAPFSRPGQHRASATQKSQSYSRVTNYIHFANMAVCELHHLLL